MVTVGPADRRGSSTFGCLVWLFLFVGAVYYGVQIGQVYLRYYELLDKMRFQASLARTTSDDEIRRRLSAGADSLLGRAPLFRIERSGPPYRIRIATEYADSVNLPLFKHTFVLRPRAEQPL
jgi:hypothetical protein